MKEKIVMRPLLMTILLPSIFLLVCSSSSALYTQLSTKNIQEGGYVIDDDPATAGIDIRCTIRWGNVSENYSANNQISANGCFGSSSGLWKIRPRNLEHVFYPPTYTITASSFDIDYASGVVNPPNHSDSFTFIFSLPSYLLVESVERYVESLNSSLSGDVESTYYCSLSEINGTVAWGGFSKDFENSPSVYIPRLYVLGDISGEGAVNLLDLSLLSKNWGNSVSLYSSGDLSQDGIVGASDLMILAEHWLESE